MPPPDVQASVPIANDEAIYSAKLFVFFNYQLRQHARLEMESLAYAATTSPLAGQGDSPLSSLILP